MSVFFGPTAAEREQLARAANRRAHLAATKHTSKRSKSEPAAASGPRPSVTHQVIDLTMSDDEIVNDSQAGYDERMARRMQMEADADAAQQILSEEFLASEKK